MWKAKLVFLLIVYFSGFATAVYYLAPDGRMDCNAAEYNAGYSGNSGANVSQNSGGAGAFKSMCENAYNKTAAKLMGMNEKDFKDAYDRGMAAIREMAKASQNTKNVADSEK